MEVSTREALSLLLELWRHLRLAYLKERPRISGEANEKEALGPLSYACLFYELPYKPEPAESLASSSPPIVAAFEELVRLSSTLAQTLSASQSQTPITRDSLVQSLRLLTTFVEQLHTVPGFDLTATWAPSEWLAAMLRCLESKVFITCIRNGIEGMTNTELIVFSCGQCHFDLAEITRCRATQAHSQG